MPTATPTVLGKAGSLNVKIERYATFSLALQFKDQDTGLPIDLTDATFEMHIRENLLSATTEIELSSANGRIVHTDLVSGQITLLLVPSETGGLEKRLHVYDLVATYVTLQKDRLLEGQIEVRDGVTHPAP